MTDSREPMTLAAFDEALLHWGSEIAEWPGDERRRAEALLSTSAEARALLAEEQAFSGALAAALAVNEQPGPLAARVQRAVSARRERRAFVGFRNPFPILAGAAAAAIACGAALGLLFTLAPGLDPDALLITVLGGGLI